MIAKIKFKLHLHVKNTKVTRTQYSPYFFESSVVKTGDNVGHKMFMGT